MMTWNQLLGMLIWLTLLLMTHCLRDKHGVGMELIAVLWQHRIRMRILQKWMDPPKPFLYQHIYTLSPFQMVRNCSSTINIQGYEGDRYFSLYTRRYTTIFRSMAINVHLICMEELLFLECHPHWCRCGLCFLILLLLEMFQG